MIRKPFINEESSLKKIHKRCTPTNNLITSPVIILLCDKDLTHTSFQSCKTIPMDKHIQTICTENHTIAVNTSLRMTYYKQLMMQLNIYFNL